MTNKYQSNKYQFICPYCHLPSLAVEVKEKYVFLNIDTLNLLQKYRIRPIVVCLTSGCKFSCKSTNFYINNFNRLSAEGDKQRKKLKQETKRTKKQDRFEKQNTYIMILNWAKKLPKPVKMLPCRLPP